MFRFWIRRAVALLAVVPALTLASAKQAQAQTTWTNGATGFSWNAAGNWSSGLPNITTSTDFGDTGAGAILLNGAASTLGMTFSNSVAYSFATGTGTNTLTIGSGGITMNGSAAVSIANAVAVQASQSWTNNSSALLSVGGTVALGANALTLAGSGTGGVTITGIVSGTGSIINSAASGVTTLSGANTYTGGNTVNAGILRGTVAGAFGANTGAGAITLAGGTLDLFNTAATTFTNSNITVNADSTITTTRGATAGAGVTHTVGNLSIGANTLNVFALVASSGTQGLTFGATTLTGNATINVQGPTVLTGTTTLVTLGAVTGGANSFTKSGIGNLTFSGAGSYTGGTTILGGVVQANTSTSLGTGDITIATTVAGRLLLNGGITIPNNAILNTSVSVAGVGLLQQTGTGQARINGTITVNGNPSAGGTLVGGAAVGNELVIGGPINSPNPNQGFTQREGRILYIGGGDITGLFGLSNTALVGATNGIPSNMNYTVGLSANGILNLNGFNQSALGLTLGNAATITGTVVLGANTLSLAGNIAATGSVTHTIGSTTTGFIDFGATNRNIDVPSTAIDGLILNSVNFPGSGGATKIGAGSLVARNVNFTGPLTLSAGSLAISPLSQAFGGTLSASALTFNTAAIPIRMNIGAGGEVINGGVVSFASGGTAAFSLTGIGGVLPNGTYNLINYTGATPGLAGFSIASFGHATANLVDTGTAIAVNVTGNDRVVWDGTVNGTWDINTTANWKTQTGNVATNYLQGDDVVFQDSPAGPGGSTITLSANVLPSNVTFTNTTTTAYSISAATAIGINGITGVSKTGSGVVTLATANAYTGATSVAAGTLVLNHDVTGNVVLSGSSGVNVATSATLQLVRNDGAFTFSRNLTGTGTVEVNPHLVAGGVVSHSVVFSGVNTGFTGTLRLLSPATGTYRLNQPTAIQLGNGSIIVQNNAQLLAGSGQTYANNISIVGVGFLEAAPSGSIGALRLDNATWAGNVAVDPLGARIGAHNSTGNISGVISGGNVEFNAANFNNSYTLILTGANTYGTTTIGGQNIQTAGVPTMRVNIGNGGTTGTLGTGNVVINGDGANGVLGFDRSNGYTLLTGQTITAANGTGTIVGSIARTFIDIDTLGAGFSDNGNTITLGAASPAAGGQFRIAQARANAIANISGTLTAEQVIVGSAQTGGVLNIASTAVITANNLYLGNAANMGGTVNQSAGTVNILGQLRVAHFGTETSTYNLSGGSITLTGPSSNLNPSTAAAGSANNTGDNNIDALATPTIHGGGVYLGIDGTGVFNHTGGTLTTNWIVLDNRGDTAAGANMPDGIDRYNISGAGTILNLRSQWGLTARNTSTAVSFGGGTIRVDNTGTGGPAGNTGANLTIPLDANIDTVTGSTTTLDTNGAGNRFTLTRNVNGTGTLALAGGGIVNLSNATVQNIAANITGSTTNITKLLAGTTTITGSMSGYTGNITVSAGRLNVPNNLGAGNITVADGATLGGEPILVNTLSLGTTTGSNLYIDPATPGAITAVNLIANGTLNNIFFASIPAGTGTVPAIKYTTASGTLNFSVVNANTFRTAPTVTNNTGSSQIEVNFTAGANLIWTGAASTAWNINTALNWNNTTSSTNPDVFFNADNVTFNDGPTNVALALTSFIAPASITVNNTATNYTFTSTANNQLFGPTGIAKTGAGSLTVNGPNLHSGATSVGGGTLAFNGTTSLGDGSPTNTIAILGGGRLSYTGTTAQDMGFNRAIAVGAGGGSFSHNNATAAAITIPGNVSGSDPLSFHSNLAGAGTFILTGNNSGYTGAISVDAATTGLTALRIGVNSGAPGAGSSITLNYPAAGATGNATTLDLPGTTLPAGVTLNLTSFVTAGNLNLRTQVTSSGNAFINGPITLLTSAGSLGTSQSIVQITPASGTTTINGNISAAGGGFTGLLFLRGAGNGVVNGTVNMPNGTMGKTDAGSWTINSTGNSWAATAISSGTIRLGASGAFPNAAPLTIGQASDSVATTLQMDGFNQEVNGLIWIAGNANSARGVGNSSATLSTLTINSANNNTFGSTTGITGGIITGNIAIVKTGTGVQTFGGANTYTGGTTVNGGVLHLANTTGSGTGTGAVAIGNGGTIRGTGISSLGANAFTIASGGTLKAGGATGTPGVLTITATAGGAVTFAGGSTFAVDVQGNTPGNTATNHGQLVVTGGSLNLGGATLNATFGGAFVPNASDLIHIVNFTGAALTGTFNGFPEGSTYISNVNGSGINYNIFYGTLSAGMVTLSPVPEPGSILVIVGAGLGLLRLRRRNRAPQAM